MPAPASLLTLGLVLRADLSTAGRLQLAILADRLGYASVWLPSLVGKDELAGLRAAVTRVRVGLLIGQEADDAVDLLASADLVGRDLLAEVRTSASESPDLVSAVGGSVVWQTRVWNRCLDLSGAGYVVDQATRAAALDEVGRAVRVRAQAGRSADDFGIVVALNVSIGRTMGEAEARAARDPLFAGDRHPRDSGLFGTFEDAQQQVLQVAAAGADELRVTLADEHDVADLLAQVRAAVVGPTPVLHAAGN
jgi:alkanesulfonate monooxygenase SsuD/methylene tetrahydromethanopterin reductase-like flavin-dependent oxidoreductase (luciferase family)